MKTPPLLASAAEEDEEEEPTRTPDLNEGGAPGRGGAETPDLDDADEDLGIPDATPASARFPPSLLIRFMWGWGSE